MKKFLNIILLITGVVSFSQNHATSSKYGVGSGESIDGAGNTFVGAYSGNSISTGDYNSFLGSESGKQITTGKNNSFVGAQSGKYNTTGSDNTFIGTNSGFSIISNNNNTFIGVNCGSNFNGDDNIFLGNEIGSMSSGNNNIYIGTNSINGYFSDGSNNVVITNSIENMLNSDYKLSIGQSLAPILFGDFMTAQVGINTTNLPTDYSLAVDGYVLSEGLKIDEVADWPDYVFEDDYNLISIQDLEQEIENLGHLPNIPSAKEIQNNGIDLEQMDLLLLEKIEELTLYIIQQDKEINYLIEQINLKNKSHE